MLGLDLVDDARFADDAARAAHDAVLVDLVAERLATASADEWEQRFVVAGVAGVHADATSPGVFWSAASRCWPTASPRCAPTPGSAPTVRWGPVVLVDGGPPAPGPGVIAGEQTAEILAGIGRSPDEVDALRTARVVASEPVAWA